MKFLVDAQLPVRLARLLSSAGHDVVHTTELAEGNRTTDRRICELADAECRVVVTKDRDFRDGHVLTGSPQRPVGCRHRQHHQHGADGAV